MNTVTLSYLPLEQLRPSGTASQAERRKHFDKAAIAELAESIKTVGLLNPVVARQVNGHFEIVAGERRFMAAGVAGLTEIPVSVRELSDLQVLEVQLIENLQREGLHPLAEAEGYETLMKDHGFTADELADKVGKSKAYIYARLKLTALGPAARQAFYDGHLNASTALLLARIPDAALQREACGKIINGYAGPMSYREAAGFIQRDYMLRLEDAPFPTANAELVAKAGACGPCPKRTGNQPGLFEDVKGGDVCTDPACFKLKREAWAKLQLAAATSKGIEVIAGKQAKALMPYHGGSVKGHVRLDERCYEDSKNRTYKQLLGKDIEIKMIQEPNTGALVEVVPEAIAKVKLKEAGVKVHASGNPEQAAREKKAKFEKKFRGRLLEEVRKKYPVRLDEAEMEFIAIGFFHSMSSDTRKALCALWQIEGVKGKYSQVDYDKPFLAKVQDLKLSELARLLLDCVLAVELQVSTWSDSKPEQLLAMAKRYKIDADKIRKDLAAEAKPVAKPKPAPAAKKKARVKK
jgi:ParB/RepB/Spo0J family partition protein